MIISFAGTKLIIPDVETETIKADTPQTSFVRSHKSDIEKEMGAIWAITEGLLIRSIWDVMAGSGFSGKILQKRFPGVDLHLNDLSEVCVDCLNANFKKEYLLAQISQGYAHEVKANFKPDMIFADFNDFTLRKMDNWRAVFEAAVKQDPSYFMFTDSASYGFKFKKNLAAYGVDTPEEYYQHLEYVLYEEYELLIDRVCIFGNAALVLTSRHRYHRPEIRFMDSESIKMSIQKEGGLGVI